MTSLEKVFIEDNYQNGRFIVLAAQTGGGKTYWALSFVKMAYKYGIYDKYIFVSPTIFKERDKQYDFLQELKDFELYEQFTPNIIAYIEKEVVKSRILLVLDDASAELMGNKNSKNLLSLVSTVRHGFSVTFIAIVHSLKNILAPHCRNIISYLFIGKYSNAKIINQIWEEFLSMSIKKYNEFETLYDNAMKEKQNMILIDLRQSIVDYNVKSWVLLEYHNLELKPNGKAKINKANDKKLLIEDAKKVVERRKVLRELDPKPKKHLKNIIYN